VDQELSRELDNQEQLDKSCRATELNRAGSIPNCLVARGAGAGAAAGGANSIPPERRNQPQANSQRSLQERTDDGQRMSNLMSLEIGALVYHSKVAMYQSKSKNYLEVSLGNIRHAIIEEVIGLVNILSNGGELENPWTYWRDQKCVDHQRKGDTGV
jgi:hypothetical protein